MYGFILVFSRFIPLFSFFCGIFKVINIRAHVYTKNFSNKKIYFALLLKKFVASL